MTPEQASMLYSRIAERFNGEWDPLRERVERTLPLTEAAHKGHLEVEGFLLSVEAQLGSGFWPYGVSDDIGRLREALREWAATARADASEDDPLGYRMTALSLADLARVVRRELGLPPGPEAGL